jgi:hypothetical protein
MKVVDILLSIIFVGSMIAGASLFALGFIMGRKDREREQWMRKFYEDLSGGKHK